MALANELDTFLLVSNHTLPRFGSGPPEQHPPAFLSLVLDRLARPRPEATYQSFFRNLQHVSIATDTAFADPDMHMPIGLIGPLLSLPALKSLSLRRIWGSEAIEDTSRPYSYHSSTLEHLKLEECMLSAREVVTVANAAQALKTFLLCSPIHGSAKFTMTEANVKSPPAKLMTHLTQLCVRRVSTVKDMVFFKEEDEVRSWGQVETFYEVLATACDERAIQFHKYERWEQHEKKHWAWEGDELKTPPTAEER
ncbi:MAG: hypothetical protein Q9160_000589 [Pyrenula sp. 1 TL-2023]